ncbi:MAG: hypothetical protein H0X33_04050 [Taibaiella sp.]|nr:hypothetical protein [Taibaiella sp.]
MYENKYQKLAPMSVFYRRIFRSSVVAFLIIMICLLIGIAGYHYIAAISWIDSLHNASMILGGMGPVVEVKPFWGKIFSSIYALFCGVMFITTIGILMVPVAHRFFHSLHIDPDEKNRFN